MSFAEILIVSVGLSLDVFVAVTYISSRFSKICVKNMVCLSLLFGGIQQGCMLLGNLVTLLPMFPGAHQQDMADRWEILTVLIFAGLGVYMICKGIKKEQVLERRQDEIEWKKTTELALLTSIDALIAGVGLGFLDRVMIVQTLTLFPVTVILVILGIYAGYRLGTDYTRRAYWAGGALFFLACVDVLIFYSI